MAINNQVSSSMSYINSVAASVAAIAAPSTALSTTAAVESVVQDGVLVPGDRVTRPGVFTAGTASESTRTNYSSSF
jgi:sporulation-control protein spo0M